MSWLSFIVNCCLHFFTIERSPIIRVFDEYITWRGYYYYYLVLVIFSELSFIIVILTLYQYNQSLWFYLSKEEELQDLLKSIQLVVLFTIIYDVNCHLSLSIYIYIYIYIYIHWKMILFSPFYIIIYYLLLLYRLDIHLSFSFSLSIDKHLYSRHNHT